jgi:hypothetical protein
MEAILGAGNSIPVMPDYSDLFILGHASDMDECFKIVALRFKAVFFGVERLGAASVAYGVRDDETDSTRGPSFDLMSPSIADIT